MNKLIKWVKRKNKQHGVAAADTALVMVIGAILLAMVMTIAVPIMLDTTNRMSLSEALSVLGDNGYVAYGAPTGDWTTIGDLYTQGIYAQADSLWDIGTNTTRYRVGYFDSLVANNVSMPGGAGSGNVTYDLPLTDHTVIRGDGGAAGIQDSGVTIDDSDNIGGTGSVTSGADSLYDIGASRNEYRVGYYDSLVASNITMPTGRAAMFIVAANDTLPDGKAQADYVCDGVADNVEIQAAIGALPVGRTSPATVKLVGSFSISTKIDIPAFTTMDLIEAKITTAAAIVALDITGNAVVKQPIQIIGGILDGNSTGTKGISVADAPRSVEISGMQIYGFTEDAVYATGADARSNFLHDMNIHDNTQYGVRLLAGASDWEITRMVMCYNYVAMRLENGNNRISHVDIYMATRTGIELRSHHNSVSNCVIEGCDRYGIDIWHATPDSASRSIITANSIRCNSQETDDTYANIVVSAGHDTIIHGNNFRSFVSGAFPNLPKHDILLSNGADTQRTKIYENVFEGAKTSAISNGGNDTEVCFNTGWVTENWDTATLLNGNTSVVVTHGLSAAPTAFSITWGEDPTNAIADWWIDNINATNFTLNGADPGASNLDFYWEAKVR